MSDAIGSTIGATGGYTLPAPAVSPGPPVQKTAPVDPGGPQAPIVQATGNQGGQHTASPAAIHTALTQVRDFMKRLPLPAEVEYFEDKASGQSVFKVVNPTTGDVIRQVPSEDILNMARKLKAMQDGSTGLLIDQQS